MEKRVKMRFLKASSMWQFVVLALASATLFVPAASAGTVYFEVAERPEVAVHHDSFVLPLSNSEHIQHARDLIAQGPEQAGGSIVFARIEAGSDGINRNLLAEGQPEWSWHVAEVHGFGDFGIELIDSWPTYVEQNLPAWLSENEGAIGFWSYTVVRELEGYPAVRPTPPNAIPLPAALPAGAAMLGAMFVAHCRRRRSTR